MRSPRSRQRAPGAGAASHEPARSHPQGRVVHDVAATARAACKSSAAERTVVHVAFHTIKTLEARSKSSNERIPRKSLSPVEKSFPASYVMLGLKGAGAPIMAIGCLSLRPVANDIPKWRAHGGSAAFGEGHVRYVSEPSLAGEADVYGARLRRLQRVQRLPFMANERRGCRLWQGGFATRGTRCAVRSQLPAVMYLRASCLFRFPRTRPHLFAINGILCATNVNLCIFLP